MKSQKLRSPAFLAILFLSISTLSGPSLQSATASSESAGSLIFQGEPVTLKLVDVSLVDFFRAISESAWARL